MLCSTWNELSEMSDKVRFPYVHIIRLTALRDCRESDNILVPVR